MANVTSALFAGLCVELRMSSKGIAGGKPEDFEAIEQAVMESPRGRWFLSEYTRRHKTSETIALLNAISKLENIVASNQDMVADRLAKALGVMTSIDAKLPWDPATGATPVTGLARHQMKFFAQDEEIFEAPATPPPAAAPKAMEQKSEFTKDTKLMIRSRTETALASGDRPADSNHAPAEPALNVAAAVESQSLTDQLPLAEAQSRRRIVIIRHKAGEEINLPFQEEARASA